RRSSDLGVISINRFAILLINSWSLDVKSIEPVNRMSPLLRAWIDSKSRCAVGSSKISTFALLNIVFDNIQRTFSPPDKTLGFFIASSPENSILHTKLLKNVSVLALVVYRLNQLTKLFALPSMTLA